jgi:hypothetical protein
LLLSCSIVPGIFCWGLELFPLGPGIVSLFPLDDHLVEILHFAAVVSFSLEPGCCGRDTQSFDTWRFVLAQIPVAFP